MKQTIMVRFVYLSTNKTAGIGMYKNDTVPSKALINHVMRMYDKKSDLQFDGQYWKVEAKVLYYQENAIDFYLVPAAMEVFAPIDNILWKG